MDKFGRGRKWEAMNNPRRIEPVVELGPGGPERSGTGTRNARHYWQDRSTGSCEEPWIRPWWSEVGGWVEQEIVGTWTDLMVNLSCTTLSALAPYSFTHFEVDENTPLRIRIR
jgi:hypothetical protein